MRYTIVLCLWAWLAGCSQGLPMLGSSGVRHGEGITQVQLDLGKPDVISDRSGDEERFYVPTKRPAWEWPAEAPRTLYYLQRDLAVTFVLGKAQEAYSIPTWLREGPLARALSNE